MHITNEFLVHAASDDVFRLLADVDDVVACVPGAELFSRGSASDFKGRVKVKVGPLTLSFEGAVVIERSDPDTRELQLSGNGRDRQGRGSVDVAVIARVVETDEGASRVRVEQDLRVTGKISQFGHGVMKDVSERLAHEFAQCLEAKLGGLASADDLASGACEAAADDLNLHSVSPPAPTPSSKPIAGLRMAWWAVRRAVSRWLRGLGSWGNPK